MNHQNTTIQSVTCTLQVINGVTCTKACRESVRKLRLATRNYDTCVCDSEEGPTCRQIRSNVARLCAVKDIPSDFVLDEENSLQRKTSTENKWKLRGSVSTKDGERYIKNERKYKSDSNANFLPKSGNFKSKNDDSGGNSSLIRRSNAVFMLSVLIWTQLFDNFAFRLS